MILVRRARNVRELEGLLNKIRSDANEPTILVDRESDGTRDPEYTVVWEQFQIDPDTATVKRARN